MPDEAIKIPDVALPVQAEALEYTTELAAKKIIRNDAEYEEVAALWKRGKAVQDKIKEIMDPVVSDAHQTHKRATGARSLLLDPVVRTCAIAKGLMDAYATAKQKQIDEENARLRKLAEEKAMQEAAEKEAESKRLLEESRQANDAGDFVAASQLLDKSETTQTEAAQRVENFRAPTMVRQGAAVPKVQGVAMRTEWSWKLTDRNMVPDEYFVLDEALISRVVREKGAAHGIPGIEATSRQSVINRR